MAISSQGIGRCLDDIGVSWRYDSEGDVLARFSSNSAPGVDLIHYELKQDFSVAGEFLNATPYVQEDGRVIRENGESSWLPLLPNAKAPTAVAMKLVKAYLIPKPYGMSIQIHAAADLGNGSHLKIMPDQTTLSAIEMEHPGFRARTNGQQTWFAVQLANQDEGELNWWGVMNQTAAIGFAMMEGPFTASLHNTSA